MLTVNETVFVDVCRDTYVMDAEKIEEYITAKREHANLYNSLLKNITGISIPVEKEWAKNVYWLYSIIAEDDYGISRDELIGKLRDAGIETRPFFMAVHNMRPFKQCKCGDMSVTNELEVKEINLPSSVGLKSFEIQRICKIIENLSKN